MTMTSRERVNLAINHQQPDRTPVDFLATPEIWQKLAKYYGINSTPDNDSFFFSPVRRQIMKKLQVDCAVISYDMFYAPSEDIIDNDSKIDWWNSLARSTPARMWRQINAEGIIKDIWGHSCRIVKTENGAYEEFVGYPLGNIKSIEDVKAYSWPKPSYWDFSNLTKVITDLQADNDYHIRFRTGSIFEYAWQLRGMEQFMIDMVSEPEIPTAIMTCITDILVPILENALENGSDLIDMVYFYDDVGSQENLLVSKRMWQRMIKPHHERLISVIKKYGKKVMYHTDGAVHGIIPELIEMGVDVLNPIQPTAKDLDPKSLKLEFGDKLSFHGGIDIVETLPKGSPEEVQKEVLDRIQALSQNGGYVMCSSHHIQSDTPVENIIAMYEMKLR